MQYTNLCSLQTSDLKKYSQQSQCKIFLSRAHTATFSHSAWSGTLHGEQGFHCIKLLDDCLPVTLNLKIERNLLFTFIGISLVNFPGGGGGTLILDLTGMLVITFRG